MKIRIIELYNMINEKKEIPQKIKYENNIYVYSANDNRYHQITKNYPNVDAKDLLEVMGVRNFNYLHDCAEIIEEPKKIEKLLMDMNSKTKGNMTADYDDYTIGNVAEHNFDVIHKKINELIDEINNLKEK